MPAGMQDFLVATVTASASFIGLLFVAISISLNEDRYTADEARTKRILAESSNTALLSVFFISLVGLIPGTSIGWVTFVMAWAGLANAGHFLRVEARRSYHRGLLLLTSGIYVAQGAYAISILLAGDHHYTSKYGFMTLIIFLFATALGRAWELTGIRKGKPVSI